MRYKLILISIILFLSLISSVHANNTVLSNDYNYLIDLDNSLNACIIKYSSLLNQYSNNLSSDKDKSSIILINNTLNNTNKDNKRLINISDDSKFNIHSLNNIVNNSNLSNKSNKDIINKSDSKLINNSSVINVYPDTSDLVNNSSGKYNE